MVRQQAEPVGTLPPSSETPQTPVYLPTGHFLRRVPATPWTRRSPGAPRSSDTAFPPRHSGPQGLASPVGRAASEHPRRA